MTRIPIFYRNSVAHGLAATEIPQLERVAEPTRQSERRRPPGKQSDDLARALTSLAPWLRKSATALLARALAIAGRLPGSTGT